MKKSCIFQTKKLHKQFGEHVVLNDVNLSLEKGHTYGLIGKNGAGKTTLMRMMCKLSFPTSGTVELFGSHSAREYTKQLSKIGVLIEYPSLYGKMTAKENLKLNRIIRGTKKCESDDELLELVGLKNVEKKKVKDFSLGMRQRLGIAIALQSNPELLILDEPVNGLDPIGVIEIRNLIKDINEKRGITILISSHNLPELFQTVTDFIILDNGVVKKVISQKELEEKCNDSYMEIECDNAQKVKEFLDKQPDMDSSKEESVMVLSDDKVRVYDCTGEKKTNLIILLHNAGFHIHNFITYEETLESYYVNVIGEGKDA
jgi:ABC-2 type transport system ATP-binding protein